MSTAEEIKRAIGRLPARERSKLRKWIHATERGKDPASLDRALSKGLRAARDGKVKGVEEVRSMIPQWAGKSS